MLLVSCSSTPILNIKESQFSSNENLPQVKKAIERACLKVGWRIESSDKQSIIAKYSYKRDKFSATVGIDFTPNTYSINYLNSHNLKYKTTSNKNIPEDEGDFLDESKEFFDENNPFSKEDDKTNHLAKTTIHKRYNQWIRELDSAISYELNNIKTEKPASASTQDSYQKTSKNNSFNCNNQFKEPAQGLAAITKSSVNIRSGASTTCSVKGSVSQNETFTLLGRQNNWYYISLDDNSTAWVYAPLVKTISNNSASRSSKKAIPAVPAPPAKSISIAVINFKTLNKKAQKISLGSLVSETFTTALVNSPGFKIIERDQLDKVVKEMEMNQTGFIETTDAVKVGKMLHADAIITGSVALLNNQIQLNARIIEIESAYVISAETRTASYNLSNITQICNDMVGKLSESLRNKAAGGH